MRVVGGTPVFNGLPYPTSPVDVDTILLDQSRMRAITRAGESLSVIPSMDTRHPMDLNILAETAPPQCQFVYSETATFGSDIAGFHKRTFQDPPASALISEGAAAYHDAGTARRAFDSLAAVVQRCAGSPTGELLVGAWSADAESLHTRPGGCGRDYRLKSVVLLEVTSCGFPESVSEIVMTNLAARVPG
ncbi:sensor domain-containing protein [Mycobacterium sp. SM1]|uniref:sensor domain-containing protein n=1 Tax=Mycobacterium sp. SM1 TaxID=2816243 RepID=UPI001BCCA7AA|nr:sensor domain-containing protein [Mycobacterium sp. SM1]MBS4726986.1 sensor domain-containing protein [Mycobacterium sp. SM1]